MHAYVCPSCDGICYMCYDRNYFGTCRERHTDSSKRTIRGSLDSVSISVYLDTIFNRDC